VKDPRSRAASAPDASGFLNRERAGPNCDSSAARQIDFSQVLLHFPTVPFPSLNVSKKHKYENQSTSGKDGC
jgi:hypothetical protein